MKFWKLRVKWTIFLLIATISAFAVSVGFLLTDDRMTLALICVIAIIFTVMATVILTCFFIEIKENQRSECEMAFRRTLNTHFHPGLRISTSNSPMTLLVPSTASHFISSDFSSMMPALCPPPPSYRESAEHENTRVQTLSNAPPAYNYLNIESSNNIASFSPPPFYRPVTPDPALTSVQTRTIYFSAENVSSPSTSRSINDTSVTRVQSPLHSSTRKPNRNQPTSSTSASNVPPLNDESSSNTTSTSHITTSRSSVTQMIIDCSKAEPTLFTINREESII